MLDDVPEYVTFSTNTNHALPDPKYIALHATCAKVSYFSGAGDSINNIDVDMKEYSTLASDGSSHDVLKYAIHKAIVAF
jgi:hypothetical protein